MSNRDKRRPVQGRKKRRETDTELSREQISEVVDGGDGGPIYKDLTKSGKRYQFYKSHHGQGTPDDAQWLKEIGYREEFGIFSESDQKCISDQHGNLFGIKHKHKIVLELGTRGERIAKFWCPSEGSPWHGFPLYPLKRNVPENRKGYGCRPPKDVFLRMQSCGLVSERDRIRLYRGDYR